VKLPSDQLARPPVAPREQEIVLNVGYLRNSDGSKASETPYIFYGGTDNIPIPDYRPRLQREYDLAKRQHGLEKARETLISIRADGDTPTGLVQELIKMGQEVGFSKFALKAKSSESEYED
jgi:biopolymer transport protein ExbD